MVIVFFLSMVWRCDAVQVLRNYRSKRLLYGGAQHIKGHNGLSAMQ